MTNIIYKVQPPATDELLTRHIFYANVATQLSICADSQERQSNSRDRLHDRIDEVGKITASNKDELTAITIKTRTLASIASVMWVLVAGAVGWSIDKSITKLDTYIEIIDKNSKQIESMNRDVITIAAQKESIDALKRVVTALQTEVDDLQQSRKGK